MTHVKREDFRVGDVPPRIARAFIIAHHYSKGCSNTAVYAHGLYRVDRSELVGVALWLPPTKVAAQSVNAEEWTRVLALTRLAIHPDVGTNGASLLLGASIRLIKADRKWRSLVTYADEFMGHTGAIYRTTNWQFVGTMKGSPRWEDETGRQVARKSTVSRTDAEMRALGYKMTGVFRKHKFVLHLRWPRRGRDAADPQPDQMALL